MHLAEYPATIAGVKRGLKHIGYSQNRAAKSTQQSPALVSMVLSKKIKSQPCLDKLAALINLVKAKPEAGPGGQMLGASHPNSADAPRKSVAAGSI